MLQRQGHTVVPDSVPSRLEIFSFSMVWDLQEMVGQNCDSYFILQNIPGLNPKSLQSTFVLKAYVLFVQVMCQMGILSLTASLMLFDKSRLMPSLDFSFSFHHSNFTPEYNTHTLILDIISYLRYTSPSNAVHWSGPKLENGSKLCLHPQ